MPEQQETAVVKRAKPAVKPFVTHEEFIDLKRYLGSLSQAGAEEDLKLAISTCDKPRFQLLRERLRGRKTTWNMAELFKDCGITLKDLMEVYTAFKGVQAKAKIAHHMPDVAETTARDAISQQDLCPRCNGAKQVDITDSVGNIVNRKDCPRCKGTGEITIPGIESARKLVFETMGFTGRNAPLVAQQFNVNMTESVEESVAFTQSLLEDE